MPEVPSAAEADALLRLRGLDASIGEFLLSAQHMLNDVVDLSGVLIQMRNENLDLIFGSSSASP